MSSISSKIKFGWQKSFLFRMVEKHINNKCRISLKNDSFTILCPNCIGGCIYHRLGKKFLSPTINMWMTQPDFVKFLLHLDEYLSEQLKFVESNDTTPTAKLGRNTLPEIILHFNHANSNYEADKQWNDRKTRINRDNLYVILYYLDGITENELHLLDDYPCRNKIVLTSTKLPTVTWSKYIKKPKFGQYPDSYLGRDVFGVRHYEKKWNFVGFLNK